MGDSSYAVGIHWLSTIYCNIFIIEKSLQQRSIECVCVQIGRCILGHATRFSKVEPSAVGKSLVRFG